MSRPRVRSAEHQQQLKALNLKKKKEKAVSNPVAPNAIIPRRLPSQQLQEQLNCLTTGNTASNAWPAEDTDATVDDSTSILSWPATSDSSCMIVDPPFRAALDSIIPDDDDDDGAGGNDGGNDDDWDNASQDFPDNTLTSDCPENRRGTHDISSAALPLPGPESTSALQSILSDIAGHSPTPKPQIQLHVFISFAVSRGRRMRILTQHAPTVTYSELTDTISYTLKAFNRRLDRESPGQGLLLRPICHQSGAALGWVFVTGEATLSTFWSVALSRMTMRRQGWGENSCTWLCPCGCGVPAKLAITGEPIAEFDVCVRVEFDEDDYC